MNAQSRHCHKQLLTASNSSKKKVSKYDHLLSFFYSNSIGNEQGCVYTEIKPTEGPKWLLRAVTLQIIYSREVRHIQEWNWTKSQGWHVRRALGVPVTDHTYEDCRLMISAGELTLPMEAGLVEFTKISRKLK